MPSHKWRTVQIPTSLYEQILEVVSNPRTGYTGVSDFVRESIRKRLEDYTTRGDDANIPLTHALDEDLRRLYEEKGQGNFHEFIRGILVKGIEEEKKG
jgi:Arc/MetJ-type ribon-helix-helix transcriptional regulator